MLLFTKMVSKVHKTAFIILFSLLSGLIFSCSNSSSSITVYQEVDTLRNYVQNKEIGVLWTKEMDENALNSNIRSFKEINTNASFNIDGIKALRKWSKPVYPSLKGFTSLDISSIDEGTLTAAISFYDAVNDNKKEIIDTFFDSSYIFNYVFFMEDLKSAWKNCTDSDYPEFDSTEEKLFSNCYVGSAFFSEEYYQIPMRFVSLEDEKKKTGFYIDIVLFIKNDSDHKIANVEVTEWGKLNG